ncbi:unnamed protein product [Zymoseptoria tritici ST99CH_3D1]|nr:unnamed protein product [Zymoseptoria tritici ST99CH_3D1]
MADLSDGPAPASQDGPPRDAQSPSLVGGLQNVSISEPSASTIRLPSLYMLDAPNMNNTLLQDLTRVAKPAVPCQIVRDGTLLPPQFDDYVVTDSRYWLSCTYNKLLLAPTVLLECKFFSDSCRYATDLPYLTLVLEFHFCNFGKDGHRISSYVHTNGQLSFTSTRATCSGFNKIRDAEVHLNPAQRKIVDLLKGYTDLGPTQEVLLKLHDSCLSAKSDEPLRRVQEVRAHLPGGEKMLLPSIKSNEEFHVVRARSFDLRPYCLAANTSEEFPKRTMVPLDCGDTFSTVDEACIQLAHSASIADAEVNEAVRLWASVGHTAWLHRCGTTFVLGVMFERYPTLGNDQSRLKLPKSLEVTITTGVPKSLIGHTGHRMDEDPTRRNYHAVFRITPTEALEKHILKAGRRPRSFKVRLSPHEKSFILQNQMDTVADLRHAERWHPVLLNQRHDDIERHDTTAKAAMDHEALDHMLRTCKPWNAEQLQVIDSVISQKGISCVLGTAGTGKTTLHKALGLYYWCLGYHVLSLAPANKDANHVASQLTPQELRREFPSWDLSQFDFMRLFPGSKDIKIENMTENQARVNKVGHEGGGIVPFRELLIALDEEQKVKGTVREYSIVHTLIRTAEAGGLPAEQSRSVHMAQQWAHLKRMIAAYRLDQRTYLHYHTTADKHAYTECKAELVRRNRFMVTTTSRVRSSEMIGRPDLSNDEWKGRPAWMGRPEIIGNWFRPTEGVPHKAVVVLVDEATFDAEVNLWSGIVCDQWADAVEAVFCFGDDRQLRPPNKSADRKVQYNHYLKRLDISLPLRLKREGWPCFELKEQYRMHACIADFPNRNIYDGQLRNGPVTYKTLEQTTPGLRAVLLDIIMEYGTEGDVDPSQYRLTASDAELRLHWIEVYGQRVKDRSPWAVKEHSDVVLNQIMPQLCKYFNDKGEKTSESLMIIAAYNYQADLYKEGIRLFLGKNPKLGEDDVPRVLTIDSSMGKESCMVIFDGSCQDGDKVGFLSEDTRMAVAITRSSDVFWIVGGAMRVDGPEKWGNNLIRKYKLELDRKDQVSRFTTQWQKDCRQRAQKRRDQEKKDEEQKIQEARDAAVASRQARALPADRPQLRVEEEEFSE